jgi:hypothetical protein
MIPLLRLTGMENKGNLCPVRDPFGPCSKDHERMYGLDIHP